MCTRIMYAWILPHAKLNAPVEMFKQQIIHANRTGRKNLFLNVMKAQDLVFFFFYFACFFLVCLCCALVYFYHDCVIIVYWELSRKFRALPWTKTTWKCNQSLYRHNSIWQQQHNKINICARIDKWQRIQKTERGKERMHLNAD